MKASNWDLLMVKLDTLLGNVDGITLLFDFVTDLGSLDGYFDGYNDGKI